MKRIIPLLLLLLLLVSPTAACGSAEDVEYYITGRYIRRPTGNISLTQYEYDENWNLLSTITTLDGEFSSAVEYTYSEDASIVTMTATSAHSASTSTQVHRTFDDQGKILRAEACVKGNLVTATEYTYDDQGREIKAVGALADGQRHTVEHIYDKHGNLLTYISDTGYAVTRQEFTYDQENRRITAEYYQNGQLANRIDYTYENGVQKGMCYDAEDKHLQTSFSTFDENGNMLTEEVFDVLGTLQTCTRYAYTGTDGSISSGIPE